MKTSSTLSRRVVISALGGTAAFAFAPRAFPQSSVPPPLSVYGKLPAVENVALSPDGKRVALVMDKNGERAIYDYDLSTGKAAAAIIEGDKLRELTWADNGRILVVTSKTVKDVGRQWEQWFGLMMDLPAGKRLMMYDNIPGVNTTVVTGNFNRIKLDNNYRVTASSWKVPEGINMVNSDGGGNSYSDTYNDCLFAFNPITGRGLKLDEDPRPVDNWVLRPNGDIFARAEYDDQTTKIYTIRMKGAKGWREVYTVKAVYDRPSLMGIGRDSEKLLVRMNGGEDAGRFFELDAQGTLTPIELTGHDNYPIFHPVTFLLAGFGNSGPIETFVFYDSVMQRLPILINKALPDSFNQLVSIAENSRQVLVRSENAEDPGTYIYFDFTTGDFKSIGSAYPDLPAEWMAKKSYITYQAADGLEIGAWLTLPPLKEAKNLALVVLPHGGPQASDDARFDWLSQAIASRGYVVLQPNYRGSDGYGKAFVEKGYGEFGRKMQTDLSDGVSYLVKQGIVDRQRVAIAGGSYGGYAALAGVSLQKDIYRCAVSIAGLSDLSSFRSYVREWHNFDSNSYSMKYWQRYTGDDSQLDDISPLKQVSAITVPVLLIHGKDDTVVPFNQSELIYNSMKKAGKPVEMVIMAGEDHWLSREPSRIQTLSAMMDFLLKHNPPA